MRLSSSSVSINKQSEQPRDPDARHWHDLDLNPLIGREPDISQLDGLGLTKATFPGGLHLKVLAWRLDRDW